MLTFMMLLLLTQQLETNNTGIEVLGIETNEHGLVFHLKNGAKPLMGITIRRGAFSEQTLAVQPSQVKAPYALFDETFSEPPDRLASVLVSTIEGVLFTDGTGLPVKSPAVIEMKADLDGMEEASRQVLDLLNAGQDLNFLPGIPGRVESVVPPANMEGVKVIGAYAGGFLSVKERALNTQSRKKDNEGREQRLADDTGDLRFFCEQVIELGKRRTQ